MVDCKWGKRESGTGVGDLNQHRPLSLSGDKFALASGLMEITYNTGAKVILRAR